MFSHRDQIWRLPALTFAASLAATLATPCQRLPNIPNPPPTNVIPCRIEPSVAVSNGVDPFMVFVSITNYPTSAPFPPPFQDDLDFNVTVGSGATMIGCDPASRFGQLNFTPKSYSVQLDEAWSPFADEPTSDRTEIVASPLSAGDVYFVSANVCSPRLIPPGGCLRACSVSLCIPVLNDPLADPTPTAEFVDPAKDGAAGSVIPFDLRVHRNGYPKGVPLTVRVLPENFSDPIDIFPLTPSSLSTTGHDVLGDEELVTFQCSTHYPCFVGVENVYHVTIHDGATLLWDSRFSYPNGMAHSAIDRSPMAHQELVAIDDDGLDGELATGEHGFIRLRLYGRNPYFASSLRAASLETALPAGLTISSYALHHHDNPMDAYNPTPVELLATGVVTNPGGGFRVDAAEILARFVSVPVDPPPTVFFDLFEVELVLETPAGGYPTPIDLVFPGVTVAGTAEGLAKLETSGPLTVSVKDSGARPPNPTGILFAVKAPPSDVQLQWADSPIDALHGAADFYRLYRSLVRPPVAWSALPDIPNRLAVNETGIDLGALSSAPPHAVLHHYRVSAFNLHGSSGDEP